MRTKHKNNNKRKLIEVKGPVIINDEVTKVIDDVKTDDVAKPPVTFSESTEIIDEQNESDWSDIESEDEEQDLNESRLRDVKRQTPGKALKKTKALEEVVIEE